MIGYTNSTNDITFLCRLSMLSSYFRVNSLLVMSTGFLKLSFLVSLLSLTACQSSPDVSTRSSRSSPEEEVVSSSVSIAPNQEAIDTEILDTFDDQDTVNAFGGSWFTYNDEGAGGDSEVSPYQVGEQGAEGSPSAAKMTGKVTKTIPFSFIGLATSLNEESTSVDLSQYKGIVFWAKGDGKPYRLQLQSPIIKDFNYYGYVFTPTSEWKRYEVRFDQMTQEYIKDETTQMPLEQTLSQVDHISLITYPQGETREDAQLELDNVQFIQ